MATSEIIRYLRDDIGQTKPSDSSCNYAPTITLVYDVDGPRGAFGNIMAVSPNVITDYEFVIVKCNYMVDITTGGFQTLNGITLMDGDHVWLAGQTNPPTAGIYIVRSC